MLHCGISWVHITYPKGNNQENMVCMYVACMYVCVYVYVCMYTRQMLKASLGEPEHDYMHNFIVPKQ